jgi:WD40 repeat protein
MIIKHHSARITCIKFSGDWRYLISCDSDGLILHYGLKKTKEYFPYELLYKVQDQQDEILTIDSNQTLDMYCTLSRDGTITLRCQRTSTLWH